MVEGRMRSARRWTALAPIVAVVLLAGCRPVATEEEEEGGYEPATVEPIKGSEVSRVTLTEDAARRIQLQTATATEVRNGVAVPESAVWVDVNGDEWVYTNPEGLEFVRAHVVVDRYLDGVAYLEDGLAPGTEVASVGVPQLIGSEFGI
jgi:hypothetical protein